MPRHRKPPRLYLRKGRSDRGAMWFILDGATAKSTGCREHDFACGERALAEYIAGKYTPPGALAAHEIFIAEVMAAYLQQHAARSPSREFLVHTSRPIVEWWGARTLAEINAPNCQLYVDWRTQQRHRRANRVKFVGEQTARHELKTLRTAINWYHANHGPLPSKPTVTLPPRAPQREDYWLTRGEAAARIWAARRNPLSRHIARFILIGIYSATRPGAILELKWLPSPTSGWFDLEHGVLHRRGANARRSKKRQPPAKIHERLLPHLVRWKKADLKLGIVSVIHFKGDPVKKLRRSWNSVAKLAGAKRDDAPHIVRHTAATWQMHAGTDIAQAAAYLGMTPETLWEVYGHHHPDYQADAARAVPRKKRARNS